MRFGLHRSVSSDREITPTNDNQDGVPNLCLEIRIDDEKIRPSRLNSRLRLIASFAERRYLH